ncbi:hypothetical protein [Promicromonospora sp. NPDC059942]|uniref:hypothetical protein n=1 Tax=Promicromonospora sp. NPDC059942 TaxID=3347009 RepID=UPI00364AB051
MPVPAMRDSAPGAVVPLPAGARTYEELAARLADLRRRSGVTYRELHRRVVRLRRESGRADVPAFNTVYRCLQPGRRRLDDELVADVARALLPGPDGAAAADEWRRTCRVVAGLAAESAWARTTIGLPAGDVAVVGRRTELEAATGLSESDLTGPVVIAVDGMPGVGKTAFAVHAAHLLLRGVLRGAVPLFADLRGGGGDRVPAEPSAVLAGFLRGMGASPRPGIGRRRTADLAGQLRHAAPGRPLLLLLDDAGSADQVLPLVPDRPGTVVLVTSRTRLTGLRPGLVVRLGPLAPGASVELLRHEIGAGRVDTDLPAAAAIARLCGHLPLALTVHARQVRERQGWSLYDHHRRAAAAGVDDEVGAAIGASCALLPETSAALLRLVAWCPGPVFDVPAAAALAGVAQESAADAVHDLVRRNLVLDIGAGRFTLHELVRDHARATSWEADPATARQEALRRLTDHHARA